MRIAIVHAGDRATRLNAIGENGRFADLFVALRAAGHHVELAVYNDEFSEEVRTQLLGVDVALVWVNPIHEGTTRTVFDHLLRDVAAAGVFVSTHPDVILKLGTKQVLFDSRHLGWGCDTRLYQTVDELQTGLAASLASGPRVVKQHRGSSGDGVFRVEIEDPLTSYVAGDTQVRVRHAKRNSTDEVMSLHDFCVRCDHYFDHGIVIDQEFQPRIGEGMIRCYLVQGQVAGFGHQAVNALIPATGTDEAPVPGQRLYHPPTLTAYQALKTQLETEWVPQLQQLLDIPDDQLPLLWDCDFLLGPRDGADSPTVADSSAEIAADTFVLCEINVSSVAPYPESIVPFLVEAVETVATAATVKTVRPVD